MYRKIYRQEGGLAEEGYRAQLRQAREKAIEDWNKRTRGEVAERVRPRPRRAYRPANIPLDTERQQGLPSIVESKQPNIIERAKNLLPNMSDISNQLFNQDQIIDLAVKYGEPTGSTGKVSDARHRAVINELSKTLSPGMIPDMVGDIGAFGAGLMIELPALFRGFTKENFGEIIEDVVSNWKGSFGTPNITTPEQIYEEVYGGPPVDRFKKKQEQVDEYGGLADLPEAQTVDTYKDKIYPQISFKDLPPNYQEYINNLPPNQQRSELAKIPPGYMPKPTYVKDKGWGYTEFDPFDEIPYYREFYNVPSREDIIPAGQPTGFEGTGYGGLADLPEALADHVRARSEALEREYTQNDWGEDASNYYNYLQNKPNRTIEETAHLATLKTPVNMYKSGLGMPEIGSGSLRDAININPYSTGTGYGQFSPQAAGGVYRPTGNIGLRPAGTTPTNINTRPYQPLAAY